MAADNSRVEVGVLDEVLDWMLESRFFPSKVGGKPAWLDLKNISIDVLCEVCSKPCIFLCQLYAPIPQQDNAFRRTIFVFVCKNPECCKVNKNGNFKVFRCQLPQINDYYVPEEPNDEIYWHPESRVEKFNATCVVCGCLGSHQCGKCKVVKYCSKEHQIVDWKSGHNVTCGTRKETPTVLDFLFPEYEIFIEPETFHTENESEKKVEKSDEEKLKEYEELLKEGKAGSLEDVPSDVMEQLALGKEDKYLKNYKEKLKICPDQVVRYEIGGQPLWIAEPNLNKKDIPNCEICQGERQFEFQILSTLLTYLDVDSLGESIDWGTLLVYTCKNNCDGGPAYKKEFLWKQDF